MATDLRHSHGLTRPEPPTVESGQAALLAELAVRGWSGDLWIEHEDGAITLQKGLVIGARAAWVPTADAVVAAHSRTPTSRRTLTGNHPITLDRIRREATLDAATALLARDGPSELTPADAASPWADPWALPASRVLAEVARRLALLRALEPWVDPWTRLRRAERLSVEHIRLRPAEWEFLGAVGSDSTPVDLAHRLGSGVVESVILGYRLLTLGTLRSDRISESENLPPIGDPPFLRSHPWRPSK